MLKINNLYTIAEDDNNKKILNGLNLEINPGEVHVIMGPNGSGKSTLANTILNNPRYIVTQGNIEFEGQDITNMRTNEIAKLGIFMSFQTPEEIPGITLAHFLKSTKKSITGEKQSIVELSKEISENMNKLDMNRSYLNRDFNVGFSGGEKKKNEILQMLTYNPKLVMLDETDSGLDVDAIKVVSKGIKMYKNDENAVLIITHNNKILQGLNIDFVHVIVNGKIVTTGGKEILKDIEQNGYEKYKEMLKEMK